MKKIAENIISLDVEATDLNNEKGRLIEFGAVKGDLVYDEEKKIVKAEITDSYETLINPEIEVPVAIQELTGISEQDLKQAPVWSEVKEDIQNFVEPENVILGHNINFDIDYLEASGLKIKNTAFDTLELGQTIIPFAGSHALEYLAEQLGVLIGVSHRAQEDSKTTLLLLAEILNQFLALPVVLQEDLKSKLIKSGLPDYDFVFQALPVEQNQKKLLTPSQIKVNKRGSGHKYNLQGKTIYKMPLGFEGLPDVHIDMVKSPKNLVTVSNVWQLSEIPDEHKLLRPRGKIVNKRLEKALNKSAHNVFESKFLIKLLIAKEIYPNFDLGQVRWLPQERSCLWQVAGNPRIDDSEFRNQVKKDLSGEKRILDQLTLFDLVFKWSVDFSDYSIALFDLAEIEKNLTTYFTETWNLKKVRSLLQILFPAEAELSLNSQVTTEAEKMLNEFDLFFGILHLVYLNKEGEYSEHIVIDAKERQSERFAKLLKPAEKLLQKISDFKNYLNDRYVLENEDFVTEVELLIFRLETFVSLLEETFLEPDNQKIYWFKFNSEWVDMNSAPQKIDERFRDVDSAFNSVSIVDTELPELSYEYFARRLGIENYKVETIDVEKQTGMIDVRINDSFAEPVALSNFLKEHNRSATLVLANLNQLQNFFEYFSAQKEDFDILAYRYSGSLAGLREKMLNQKYEGKKIRLYLLTTSISRWAFDRFPSSELLYIQKLPFVPPGVDPALKIHNSDNDFIDNAIPKTVQTLHELLNKFAIAGNKTGIEKMQAILADERAASKYDGTISEYFDAHPGINLIL